MGTFLGMYPGEWRPQVGRTQVPKLLEPVMEHRNDFTETLYTDALGHPLPFPEKIAVDDLAMAQTVLEKSFNG